MKATDPAILATVLVLAVLGSAMPRAHAALTTVLRTVRGRVEIQPKGASVWSPARAGTLLRPEDKLRTGADGGAQIHQGPATLDVLGDSVTVVGYTSFKMKRGTAWVRLQRSGTTFQVVTPSAAMAIRGTILGTTVGAGTVFVLLEGHGTLTTSDGQQNLEPGTRVRVPDTGGDAVVTALSPAQANTLLRESATAARSVSGAGDGGRAPSPATAPGGSGASGGASAEEGAGTRGTGLSSGRAPVQPFVAGETAVPPAAADPAAGGPAPESGTDAGGDGSTGPSSDAGAGGETGSGDPGPAGESGDLAGPGAEGGDAGAGGDGGGGMGADGGGEAGLDAGAPSASDAGGIPGGDPVAPPDGGAAPPPEVTVPVAPPAPESPPPEPPPPESPPPESPPPDTPPEPPPPGP